MTTLLLDYDPLLYSSGSVGETRSIKVVHRKSGDEYEFPNRTAWYGHHLKKAGGYLGEWNSVKAEHNRRAADEFDITDVQTPEPIASCLHTLKRMIEGVKEAVGADGYYGYSGKGKTFRDDVATIWGYKANRLGALRPVHLEEMKTYLCKYHACKIVTEIEADDACTIDSYDAYKVWKKTTSNKDKLVLGYSDKDYLGITGHIYNLNGETPVSTFDGLGSLFLNDKGEVKGRGRMWFYFQVLSSDVADNYAANSASDLRWGPKAAYNLLKGCATDKQAFEAMMAGYKTLYPSPKKIIGWRGYEDPDKMLVLRPDHKDFEIEIDWKYVFQENFTLARMLRWENDNVDVKQVMDKLGVDYKD